MAHLEASKIERVPDVSGSDGRRVDVVDRGPFPRYGLLISGRATASCLFVRSYFAILCVAPKGCVGLTEVLAAGVVARTWVGLDISG